MFGDFSQVARTGEHVPRNVREDENNKTTSGQMNKVHDIVQYLDFEFNGSLPRHPGASHSLDPVSDRESIIFFIPFVHLPTDFLNPIVGIFNNGRL